MLLFATCVYLITGHPVLSPSQTDDSVTTISYKLKGDTNSISIVFFCLPGDEKCLSDQYIEQTFGQWIPRCINLCSANPKKDPNRDDKIIINCTLTCVVVTSESQEEDEYGDNNVTSNNNRPNRTISITPDQLKEQIRQKLIDLRLPS